MRSEKELSADQILLVIDRLVGSTDWYGETYHDCKSMDNLPVLDEIVTELLRGMINTALVITKGQYGNGSAMALNRQMMPMLEYYKVMIEDCIMEVEETKKEHNAKETTK